MAEEGFFTPDETSAVIGFIGQRLTLKEIVDFFGYFDATQPYIDEVLKHPDEIGTCLASLLEDTPKADIVRVLRKLKPSLFSGMKD